MNKDVVCIGGLSCGTWDLHFVTWDLLLWHMYSLVVAHGLQRTSSVVAIAGLDPCLMHCEVDS